MHPDTCFATLTYEEKHLPTSVNGYPTLDPSHLQLWLKRFRGEIVPLKIRFYACGEYGDQTWRPHYHLAIFGFPMCTRGRTMRVARTNRPDAENCCYVCNTIWSTWGKGDVDVGELTTESSQYIAGYVTKKMTKADDIRPTVYRTDDGSVLRFCDLDIVPEFSRQSLRPGIGAGFMPEVARTLNSLEVDLVAREGDVPSTLRHGSRLMPIGRYLRGKLREEMGLEKKAPQSTLDKAQAKLQPLRDRAFENSRSFKDEVVEEFDNKLKQAANRRRIFEKGKKL